MKNQTPQQIPLTYEAMMALMYENERILTEKFSETDRLIKETREDMKETDRLIKENAEQMKDTDRRMKKLQKTLGEWANNHGSFAEEYFFNSFEDEQQDFFGEHFNDIDKNLKPSKKNNIKDEYDIVMYNDSYVAIVETKFKAHQNDIPDVIRKAETFRILCPDYKDYKIYLGLASLSFYDELEQDCIKNGIAIIKQVGDTVVINDAHLKVF